jgi:hypothetical protein
MADALAPSDGPSRFLTDASGVRGGPFWLGRVPS